MGDSSNRRGTKAEWVTLMALIAERDRDVFRGLRKEAWESIVVPVCSRKSN